MMSALKYLAGALLLGLFAGGLASCQATGSAQPAVLEQAGPGDLETLKSVIAEAMGKARVDFGPGDLTKSSEIAVLPPRPGPHETHSLAVPTLFDLALQDGNCIVIRRETGEAFALPDVACKPLED